MLFNDLREAGDCGEDLLGIAVTPPPLLSLCWSRDRTNHVLVIRLETAADQDVFLSRRAKFSSFVFISPFLLGISLFESPVSGLFGIFSSRFILIVGLGRFSLRIPR